MTKDEALKMCLEYIETDAHERKYVRHAIKEALAQTEHGWTSERITGMSRLKEAQDKKLAQPEQPKVRTGNCLRVGVCASEGHKIQPQRKPLTDEEIAEFAERMEASDPTDSFWREFARSIEAAHGIKGLV